MLLVLIQSYLIPTQLDTHLLAACTEAITRYPNMNQSTNNNLQGIGTQFDDTELLPSTSSQHQGSVQFKPTLK